MELCNANTNKEQIKRELFSSWHRCTSHWQSVVQHRRLANFYGRRQRVRTWTPTICIGQQQHHSTTLPPYYFLSFIFIFRFAWPHCQHCCYIARNCSVVSYTMPQRMLEVHKSPTLIVTLMMMNCFLPFAALFVGSKNGFYLSSSATFFVVLLRFFIFVYLLPFARGLLYASVLFAFFLPVSSYCVSNGFLCRFFRCASSTLMHWRTVYICLFSLPDLHMFVCIYVRLFVILMKKVLFE